uniref:Sulfotransfer_1 domain-containing protein n=1 Tax=Parastrongyloides trichosuri TaxID=131310 RepID=A0A0N4ZLB2_PARTI
MIYNYKVIFHYYLLTLYLTNLVKCEKTNLFHRNVSLPRLVKPKDIFEGNHVIAPKYNLTSCYIGKTLSSMTIGLFCYLFDEKKFLKEYKHKRNGAANRLICKNRNKYNKMSKIISKYANNNQTKFFRNWSNVMIVRDPVSRFISGFVQLCVLEIGLQKDHPYCFHCKNNMECFLEKLYTHLHRYKYVTNEKEKFIAYHFYPQAWQCEYQKYKKKYEIIKYKSDIKSFFKIFKERLQKSSIPSGKIKFIMDVFAKTKVSHSTYDKKETIFYRSILLNDQYLLSLIRSIYYDDFKEFDFKFP